MNTGDQFGRLTVIERAEDYVSPSGYKKKQWVCLCICGASKILQQNSLVSGLVKSCGCYASEQISDRNTTHGFSQHPLYNTWRNMLDRCSNIDSPVYKHYGGRGISVCAEWRVDFEKFCQDVGEKPTKDHSLDRIDNDGDYCRENIKWSTKKEQVNNRRINYRNKSGVEGVYFRENTQKYEVWHGSHYHGSYTSFEEAFNIKRSLISE